MKTVIFDIDGTLADISHRVGRIPNWKHFQTDHHLDKPNEAVVAIYQAFRLKQYEIMFVTGRLESERGPTTEWLIKHLGTMDESYLEHRLIMRPDGDYKNDDLLKEEILKDLKNAGHEILFVVDDRKRVVDMWRRNGIMCLQCAEGDY